MFGSRKKAKREDSNPGEETVTRDAVIREFAAIEKRHAEDKERERRVVSAMPVEQRNLCTRDERVIENFQDQQEKWHQETLKLSKKSDRSVEQLRMARAGDYRRKVEYSLACENTKQDRDKFGERIWYMQLRKYNTHSRTEKEPSPSPGLEYQDSRGSSVKHRKLASDENIQSDIFSGFMTVTLNDNEKELEIIRQPLSQSRAMTAKTRPPSTLQARVKTLQEVKLFSDRIPFIQNDEQLSELVIIGANKLASEKTAVLSRPTTKLYQKFDEQRMKESNDKHARIGWQPVKSFKKKAEDHTLSDSQLQRQLAEEQASSMHMRTETIQSNYDLTSLSRSGRHVFPNLVEQVSTATVKKKMNILHFS